MKPLSITAANSITAVGHDGRMTAACVRAGIAGLTIYEGYRDGGDNPITVARIEGIMDDCRDTAVRLARIATICLRELLDQYLEAACRTPSHIHLLLGVASAQRPGPRYEDSCMRPLADAIASRVCQVSTHILPQGNASLPYAVGEAARLIESNPGALCIVGGIDSLLTDATLNWLEEAGRLKSATYGRHQGLMAGEAVSFLILEDRMQARQGRRPELARISGLGLALDPEPRALNLGSRSTGLTEACHGALTGMRDRDIRAVFGDLNGENSRAREWSFTDMRCFAERHELRQLWTPGNCYGDIGAASGAVLVNLVAQGLLRSWVHAPVLIFCSDDHGACGAIVLDTAAQPEGEPE